MNGIEDALFKTVDTLMFLPLIIFCFLPVTDKIKSPFRRLIPKVILVSIGMEMLLFFTYLILPMPFAEPFTILFCIFGFFWFYQREIDLPVLHLWFLFVTACLIGAFGYLMYYIVDMYMYPWTNGNHEFLLSGLLAQIAFEVIIILILYHPTKKYFGWILKNFYEEKIWRLIWVFPFLFTAVIPMLVPENYGDFHATNTINLYLVFLGLFLFAAIFLYVLFYHISFSMVMNQQMMEKKNFLEIQEKQYQNFQEEVNQAKRLRHDFHHQLIALDGMLKQKEYKKAQEFLAACNDSISPVVIQYCEIPIINAVLNHYASICREHDILAKFYVNIEHKIKIEEIDICVLLGNLLENAVYASSKVSSGERILQLRIAETTPHIIVLRISNSYNGTVFQHGDKFLSTKHEGVGQGIKSVARIVDKYHGTLKINYENEVFSVKILIYV